MGCLDHLLAPSSPRLGPRLTTSQHETPETNRFRMCSSWRKHDHKLGPSYKKNTLEQYRKNMFFTGLIPFYYLPCLLCQETCHVLITQISLGSCLAGSWIGHETGQAGAPSTLDRFASSSTVRSLSRSEPARALQNDSPSRRFFMKTCKGQNFMELSHFIEALKILITHKQSRVSPWSLAFPDSQTNPSAQNSHVARLPTC